MEFWFILLISLLIILLFKPIFNLFTSTKSNPPLPPGPSAFPVIGNLIWLKKNSFSDFQHILRRLHATLGPIVTIHIGTRPAIWVADRNLAHQALVQKGAFFADRPPALPTTKIITSNQHDIHSSFYGPLWRLLRRNLNSEIIHPSRIKSYAPARKWVLEILFNCLESEQNESGHVFKLLTHLRYSMFCLLSLMCFGEKMSEKEIKKIEDAQYKLLLSYGRFGVLNIWPAVTKFFLRKRWQEFHRLRENQVNTLIPLIKARRESEKPAETSDLCYVDTLLDLKLPEENNRRLTDGEMVSLCSEFLNAGTDPTATAMQWIMANLVKYPEIQNKLHKEIKRVLEEEDETTTKSKNMIEEEDLQRMDYLKAVVLEGLRRHPPGHFLSPHRVSEDTELGGYRVPRNGTINFMVAEMGRDPGYWEDPMEFRPERFINGDGKFEGVDITGSKEIKVMPFGAGRRICPGYGLAMLHLEYFVGNLVWKFEWKSVDGEEEVELGEKQEFITMVMKNPVKAKVYPRKL